MITKLKTVMLIDDNPHDNFFHERIIQKTNAAERVIAKESAEEALSYLRFHSENKLSLPQLIFLDINMPAMNGWNFLEEFGKLPHLHINDTKLVMLSTSDNPDEVARAGREHLVADYRTKPLTADMLRDILSTHFTAS